MLEHVYYACTQAKQDNCDVSILGGFEDERLRDFCSEKKMDWCSGSDDDLVTRYIQAIDLHGSTHAIRVTGDCPLIDPKVIKLAVSAVQESDYCSNTYVRSFPEGFDVQAASKNGWDWINKNQTDNREHPFCDLDGDRCIQRKFIQDGLVIRMIFDRGNWIFRKTSVDTKEDLEQARAYWGHRERLAASQ